MTFGQAEQVRFANFVTSRFEIVVDSISAAIFFFFTPYSLLPTPCSLFPVPCSLFPLLYNLQK
ncbi:MAG: hypothetical protein F6J94_23620 [Moorea sp. SIO1F2]|uniref:hypothetical protein n=1 Tax=Moorena sp. SIO4A5 TaxID=2607838 RepID=UPI0013B8A75F|nr:hypothetical protein [Moorena sp. SIO4A5]NEO18504.1 hypothetical protein [Moorena sp. SIO4A5]NET84794.1 hypothetical protein [Moorena sp. SIO1F2]